MNKKQFNKVMTIEINNTETSKSIENPDIKLKKKDSDSDFVSSNSSSSSYSPQDQPDKAMIEELKSLSVSKKNTFKVKDSPPMTPKVKTRTNSVILTKTHSVNKHTSAKKSLEEQELMQVATHEK